MPTRTGKHLAQNHRAHLVNKLDSLDARRPSVEARIIGDNYLHHFREVIGPAGEGHVKATATLMGVKLTGNLTSCSPCAQQKNRRKEATSDCTTGR